MIKGCWKTTSWEVKPVISYFYGWREGSINKKTPFKPTDKSLEGLRAFDGLKIGLPSCLLGGEGIQLVRSFDHVRP